MNVGERGSYWRWEHISILLCLWLLVLYGYWKILGVFIKKCSGACIHSLLSICRWILLNDHHDHRFFFFSLSFSLYSFELVLSAHFSFEFASLSFASTNSFFLSFFLSVYGLSLFLFLQDLFCSLLPFLFHSFVISFNLRFFFLVYRSFSFFFSFFWFTSFVFNYLLIHFLILLLSGPSFNMLLLFSFFLSVYRFCTFCFHKIFSFLFFLPAFFSSFIHSFILSLFRLI